MRDHPILLYAIFCTVTFILMFVAYWWFEREEVKVGTLVLMMLIAVSPLINFLGLSLALLFMTLPLWQRISQIWDITLLSKRGYK